MHLTVLSIDYAEMSGAFEPCLKNVSYTIQANMIGAPRIKMINNGAYQAAPSQLKFMCALYPKFKLDISARMPPTIKALTKVNPSASNEFFILLIPLPRKYPKLAITNAGMISRKKSCAYVSTLAEVPGNTGKITAPRKEKNNSIKRTIKMLIRNLTMKCSLRKHARLLYFTLSRYDSQNCKTDMERSGSKQATV